MGVLADTESLLMTKFKGFDIVIGEDLGNLVGLQLTGDAAKLVGRIGYVGAG